MQVLDALPDDALVTILTFDSAVRLYNLGWEGGSTSADILPGHCVASSEMLKRLRVKKATRIAPLRSCRAAAQNIISSILYAAPLLSPSLLPSPLPLWVPGVAMNPLSYDWAWEFVMFVHVCDAVTVQPHPSQSGTGPYHGPCR